MNHCNFGVKLSLYIFCRSYEHQLNTYFFAIQSKIEPIFFPISELLSIGHTLENYDPQNIPNKQIATIVTSFGTYDNKEVASFDAKAEIGWKKKKDGKVGKKNKRITLKYVNGK